MECRRFDALGQSGNHENSRIFGHNIIIRDDIKSCVWSLVLLDSISVIGIVPVGLLCKGEDQTGEIPVIIPLRRKWLLRWNPHQPTPPLYDRAGRVAAEAFRNHLQTETAGKPSAQCFPFVHIFLQKIHSENGFSGILPIFFGVTQRQKQLFAAR